MVGPHPRPTCLVFLWCFRPIPATLFQSRLLAPHAFAFFTIPAMTAGNATTIPELRASNGTGNSQDHPPHAHCPWKWPPQGSTPKTDSQRNWPLQNSISQEVPNRPGHSKAPFPKSIPNEAGHSKAPPQGDSQWKRPLQGATPQGDSQWKWQVHGRAGSQWNWPLPGPPC